jgi:hypothetical protein
MHAEVPLLSIGNPRPGEAQPSLVATPHALLYNWEGDLISVPGLIPLLFYGPPASACQPWDWE